MTDTPFLVATLNRADTLRVLVNSLLKEGEARRGVIVNNGSSDGTASYLRRLSRSHPEIISINVNRNLGFGGGMNLAYDTAKLEWQPGHYLLLNDDIEVIQPIDRMAKVVDLHPKFGMVGPLMDNCFSVEDQNVKGPEAREDAFQVVHYMMAAAWLLKDAMVEDVGVFDTRIGLYGGEDNEYILRMRKRGWIPVLDRGTFMYHRELPKERRYRHLYREKHASNILNRKHGNLAACLCRCLPGSCYCKERYDADA